MSTSRDRLELHWGRRTRIARCLAPIRGRRQGKLDHQPRPAAWSALRARASAVQQHELSHDGETDSAPTRRGFGVSFEPYVRFPHPVSIFVRNSGPLILDPDARVIAGDLGADGDD